MLQVKHLVKRYEAKGETVTALNDVSVDFPERGMVFLLGKSGSGKSTLLNVSGGLDEPDEGEIVVNGKSSKEFSKSDFDSYRNTYLGFIFQEYNILSELTVEENIALALELQGKPKDKARVDELLRQVDLAGYGDRRPNTLSGGQKQRVAIARALVKDPEIIMADEPTGALDSKTGAQVFDTLKKLSESKLVVIVSHDREFAEVYADRIIELKDGNIVSDMTRNAGGRPVERANLVEISDKKLALRSGADLSEEDGKKLLAFVRSHKGGISISAEEGDLSGVPEETAAGAFTETVKEKLPESDGRECKFIKSKFPFRYAFKMGVAGLRLKPVRLIFTTLLATVAFIVFGVFSTVITFTTAKSGAATLTDSYYQAAVLQKHGLLRLTRPSGVTVTEIDTGMHGSYFSEEEVAAIRKKNADMHFVPGYTLGIAEMYCDSEVSGSVYSDPFYGHTRVLTAFADASYLSQLGYAVHGRLPQNAGECALSAASWEVYHRYGYGNGAEPVETYEDLLGKTISITHNVSALTEGEMSKASIPLTIVGIVETGEDFSRFNALLDENNRETMDLDEWNLLEEDLGKAYTYSMSALCWVGEGFRETYTLDNIDAIRRRTVSESVRILVSLSGGAEFDSDFLLHDENGELVSERVGSGMWGATYYRINPLSEPDGSYVEYLFAPIRSGRAAKCSALFSYDRQEKSGLGYYYSAPYSFMVSIRSSMSTFNRIFAVLGTVAVALAVFAALLLFNFISASIGAKKKEIGILRAVGARGIDVYKIFMVEGVAITLVCFTLGCILSYVACIAVNAILIAAEVFSFKLFLFDGLNALIVFAVSAVTAAVSTGVPVALTVRKRPVEAIRSV